MVFRIVEGFSDIVFIMVDNIKFMMDCVVFMIYVYEYYENRWWCRDLYYDYCEDWLEV